GPARPSLPYLRVRQSGPGPDRLRGVRGGLSRRLPGQAGDRHDDRRGADDRPARPGGIPVRYDGDPPRSLDPLPRLGIPLDGTKYTLFVASLTLERVWNALFQRREHLAPAHQRAPAPLREGENPLRFLFLNALRLFLDRPVLTRTEERITLERA